MMGFDFSKFKMRSQRSQRSVIPFLFIAATCLMVIPAAIQAAQAPSDISQGEKISLDRAIAVALDRHPSILASRSAVDINQSRIGQAKANYWPQIDFSSAYNRGNISSSYSSLQSGSYNSYDGEFTGTQKIYDFGKTSSQINVQKFSADSARSDLANTIDQIVLNLKQAYFGLLQAQRNRTVAEETTRQFQQHLDQARGFYEVGTKAKFDVTKAEVDLSNAKLNEIRAVNAVRIAKVTLDNAIGIPRAPDYTVEDILSYEPYEISIDEALKHALTNRPDLQSVIAKKKAAEQSIQVAQSSYYPTLNGNARYGWSGSEFPLDNGWNVGASVSIPIFNGFLTKYQVEEARASLSVVNANELTIRQSITLDVQQALLNLGEAKERVSVAELTVRQATENLDLANGRYAAGVGSPIEVTDALVSLSNAKTSYNQALYDAKIAKASMDKAMGVKY